MTKNKVLIETSSLSEKFSNTSRSEQKKNLNISKVFIILFCISILGTIAIICINHQLDYYFHSFAYTKEEIQTKEVLLLILNILKKFFLIENIILILYCIIDFIKEEFTKKNTKKSLKFLIYLLAIITTSIIVIPALDYIESIQKSKYPYTLSINSNISYINYNNQKEKSYGN